jgi:hypothetical protein
VREKRSRNLTLRNWIAAATGALVVLCATGAVRLSSAQAAKPQGATPKPTATPSATSTKQKTFSSAQEAAAALYQAARDNDETTVMLILGPDAHDVVMWTDSADDRKADAAFFAKKYEEMHRLVKEPDDETTLYVGAQNWPLPVPLVQKGGVWYFDAGMGTREILFRRIGENEMNAIDTLRALTEAENEYYDEDISGTPVEYAPRIQSDPDSHDGLFWPATSQNNRDSPVGPYLAEASYNRPDPKPLHGYYYRVLMEQGPAAAGGARKYVVNNKMTGGFAFVAFPAEYHSSGTMSFIVGPDGVVYEKDLGPSSTKTAAAMPAYNPDKTWTRTE